MIANLFQQWFGWPLGSVLTNLVASVIFVVPTYMLALRHLHCIEKGCYRPGTVPVSGTTHKLCRPHAKKQGVTHQ